MLHVTVINVGCNYREHGIEIVRADDEFVNLNLITAIDFVGLLKDPLHFSYGVAVTYILYFSVIYRLILRVWFLF